MALYFNITNTTHRELGSDFFFITGNFLEY